MVKRTAVKEALALTTRALTPRLWPALAELFGANGACGGCWCMWWRIETGERWRDIKGETAGGVFVRP